MKELDRQDHKTLDRVFAADIDLKIDTSRSCTGFRAGERLDRDVLNSASRFRHMSILFSSSVSKCGEHVSFPRFRLSRILSRD